MTGFLRQPATRRDLLTSSSVLALMLVAVILLASVVAVRLHERYDVVVDENRLLIERVDDQQVQLEAQQSEIVEADEQLASVPAKIQRQVRVIVDRLPPQVRETARTVTERIP